MWQTSESTQAGPSNLQDDVKYFWRALCHMSTEHVGTCRSEPLTWCVQPSQSDLGQWCKKMMLLASFGFCLQPCQQIGLWMTWVCTGRIHQWRTKHLAHVLARCCDGGNIKAWRVMLRLASPLKCNERTFFLPLLLLPSSAQNNLQNIAKLYCVILCHTLSYFVPWIRGLWQFGPTCCSFSCSCLAGIVASGVVQNPAIPKLSH